MLYHWYLFIKQATDAFVLRTLLFPDMWNQCSVAAPWLWCWAEGRNVAIVMVLNCSMGPSSTWKYFRELGQCHDCSRQETFYSEDFFLLIVLAGWGLPTGPQREVIMVEEAGTISWNYRWPAKCPVVLWLLMKALLNALLWEPGWDIFSSAPVWSNFTTLYNLCLSTIPGHTVCLPTWAFCHQVGLVRPLEEEPSRTSPPLPAANSAKLLLGPNTNL